MREFTNRIQIDQTIFLSSIEVEDAATYVKHLNDATFSENTCSIPYPYLLSDARLFISRVKEYEKVNQVKRDWAIRLSNGELIGGIGLLYDHGLSSHRSQLGYWLARDYWKQGIMTNVLKEFCHYIFECTPLVRLEARVFSFNKASCRALEKAGFTNEGYLKKAYIKDEKYIDAYVYAMVK